jgi:site-specific recombinase XerD
MVNCVNRRIERVESRLKASDFKKYLDAFKLDCRLRNLTSKTIEGYYERLGYLFDYLQANSIAFDDIDRKVIQKYILSLNGSVSDETINGRIRVYRRFFNFLHEEGYCDRENPMIGVRLLRTARRTKPVVDTNDVQRIIASLESKSYEGNRNKVMVFLFWDGMLRLRELLSLKLDDIDLDGRLIKVFGKGRKERMVPLGIKTLRLLHQYLIKWRGKYPGDYLICMRNGRPLTERHCHKIIQTIGKKAGLKLYPHLLRHSAATWYIQQGGNPAVLQKILGHSSLLVTQNYLHLSNADTVSSYDSFSPANCLKI